MSDSISISVGRPYPLGTTVASGGVNFAVFSRNATQVYVELFREADDVCPWRSIQLHPRRNRTGDVWHVFIRGIGHGQHYGVRADGPYEPAAGHRFNVHKLLADPYSPTLTGTYDMNHDSLYGYDRASPRGDLSFSTADSAAHTVKSVALEPDRYDWGDERAPRTPLAESVIYETHVKGFTFHPSSAVADPGTYLGVIEKIPHLQEMGVTAVELLPIHEFNEGDPLRHDPVTGQPLVNYWGYSTLGFFAPEITYASNQRPGGPAFEFKELVRQLHRAGIEVILDVVFNHTGEGDETGPTLSFRGLDNTIYYMLEAGRRYKNYSGCGNTVNCNHPVLKQFILDCLRYWLVEMHVDGFRFDLATILGRARSGEWLGDLSLLYDICGDPILRGCKLIAEAWDAEGMYKVGGFPREWAEWNGSFRDDVRRFVRGDHGLVPQLARRIGGSRDIFALKRNPAQSINFVTAHDGFSLRDLVSYRDKHNLRNGEDNQDGCNDNFSTSCGAEGETDDPRIRETRKRLAKNLLTILLTSRGTPMILGGDEFWRTQHGNNNTYCQDNELSWFDWSAGPDSAELGRFIRLLIALMRRHPALRRQCFVDPFAVDGAGVSGQIGTDITWHGVELGRPDWTFHSLTLALQIHGLPPRADPDSADSDFYLIHSAWGEPLDFALPDPGPPRWRRLVDTAKPPPDDIVPDEEAPVIAEDRYLVQPRSAVVLIAR